MTPPMGRDEAFRERTMLERATQPHQPDVIETFPAFNYSVAFDPGSQVFHIIIDTPRGRRVMMPFDRLSFGSFISGLQKSLEQVQNREENGSSTDNGS